VVGALAFAIGLVYAAIRQIRIRAVLPPERYRGPSVFILLALALVVGVAITVPFAADAEAIRLGEGEVSLLGSAILLLSAQAGLLLIGYLFVYRPRALAALPSFPGPGAGRVALVAVGTGAVAWVAFNVVANVVVAILEAIGQAPEPPPVDRAIAMLDPFLVVLATVLVAPVAEELFFRGVVFNAWLREAGRRWAYLGSAALFAAIHVSIATVVPIFLLGLTLAWIYERTRTLLAPIVVHATFNALSVTLALLDRYDVIRLPAA
jgi:ABC-2 type transport system permease protein